MNIPILRHESLPCTLAALALAAACCASAPARADNIEAASTAGPATVTPGRSTQSRLDRSGHKRVGMASYYAHRFAGSKMANGEPMRPESDNAASTTLPLGTVALVTNLGNGRLALVTIRDRGPYAKGRLIDLSPRTASQLGMIRAGVARVEVTPLSIPPRPNAGAVSYNVLPLDGATFRAAARLMYRRSDPLYEDAMIAATATVHKLTVVTRNVGDFANFDVQVLNPFKTPKA